MADIQTDTLAPDRMSPGRTLAAARAARGMSVDEVAQRLKFSTRQIEALEADDHGALPGAAIVRGMIRGYARLLGLDAAPLVHDLQQRVDPQAPDLARAGMDVPFPTGPRKGGRLYLVLSLLVALGVAAVVADWVLRTREAAVEARVRAATQKTEAPAAAAPPPAAAPEPAPAQEAPPAAQPEPLAPADAALLASTARLEFRFERDSWVEVKDGQGTVVLSTLNRAGTTQSLEGRPPFAIVVGNASGVRLRFNDAEVNLAPHTRIDVARLTLE